MARTPAELPLALAGQYEQLRRRFRDGLAQRWREIESAPDAASRRAALHRLSGAAVAYGFERVGALAREAEPLCGGADAEQRLAALLAELGREMLGAAQG